MAKLTLNAGASLRCWMILFGFLVVNTNAYAQKGEKAPQGPPPSPVRVASVAQDTVSEQITLVGSTEPISRSMVAGEIAGRVSHFPVREGDVVKKGAILAKMTTKTLELRLNAATAQREKVRANLRFAEKELARYTALKDSNSVAASKYDEALYNYQSLEQELFRAEADVDLIRDDVAKKTVVAPFAGVVAEEHTEVGEWIGAGGPVVTLLDMGYVRITVDVPERYVVDLMQKAPVRIVVASVSKDPFQGKISAVLPEGDPNARTIPVRVHLPNPRTRIKSGMEARVTFSLGTKKKALLVPKDAIVTAGITRLIYVVADGTAQPVYVQVTGYYDGNVAIEGTIKAGDQVVVRGNERLRPGQAVTILE